MTPAGALRPLRLPLRGRLADLQTRCAHWHGPTDIVAFRFACCDAWWPCHDCHAGEAGHAALPWPAARFGEPSVLCGACRAELTVPEYLGLGGAGAGGDACPRCGAAFNPGCRRHHALYFAAGDSASGYSASPSGPMGGVK